MLWLLRHGDAADGSPDAERPLTKKGERQSRAAGRALKRLGVEMDACLTSPKVRAADTAKLAGGPFDGEALAAGLGDNVLLVGHDPDFSMAVHALTGAQVRMKKGGLAGVEKGELMVLLRPAELTAIAES